MAKANVKRNDKGQGREFIHHQRSMDEAKNERMRSEKGTDRLDPEQASRKRNAERKTGVSEKKAGAGKHN